jgi:hypothetical protein
MSISIFCNSCAENQSMGSIDLVSNNALQYGLKSYKAGAESLSSSATVIADASSARSGAGHSASLLSASVDLVSAKLQTNAAGKVIESTVRHDDILGSIIDTYA